MKLAEEDYRNSARYLAPIVVDLWKTARERGLELPLEVCVTGADDDIVAHFSVEKDGKLHALAGEGPLTACWPLTATIVDRNENELYITINPDGSVQ